jgi:methylated-DNA-[protein]-cysteine S-methyltransferase
MKISYTEVSSPVGPVALAWKGAAVVALDMEEAQDRRGWKTRYVAGGPMRRMRSRLEKRFGPVEFVRLGGDAPPAQALRQYFGGDLRALDRLRVDPGGTPFQAKIWAGLRRIPAGRTMTYGELAAAAGRPGAARAAGGAVGKNPVAIIIPCHRIVGSDRRLTGFGGGLVRKRWLLEHEGAAFRAG